MTFEQFKTFVLPKLLSENEDRESREKAISAFLDGNEITDADGNAIAVAAIDMITEAPADEGEGEGEGEELSLSEDNQKRLSDLITKAVDDATKEHRPTRLNGDGSRRVTIPATVKRYGRVKSFAGDDKEEKAFKFGSWVLSAYSRLKLGGTAFARSQQWCKDHGLDFIRDKAQTEGTNSAGGFLVPDELDDALIDIREQYGVFRRNADIVPMAGDTKSVPRRTGGVTAYVVGETKSITESSASWDMVNLTARKIGALSTISSELDEDAVINIGDTLANEIGYALTKFEDDCGFAGDGSTTYASIRGLKAKIAGATSGYAYVSGASGTDASWAGITMQNFSSMIGQLHSMADATAKWYCHKAFWGSVMRDLLADAGGNTIADLQSGPSGFTFLGYPVEFAQSMPKAAGTAEVVCILGSLPLASKFGDRRQTTIAFSDSAYVGSTSMFESDMIAVRGTERFDINVHDVGSSSEFSPVQGLLTAA